jgi:hypothetical protein
LRPSETAEPRAANHLDSLMLHNRGSYNHGVKVV